MTNTVGDDETTLILGRSILNNESLVASFEIEAFHYVCCSLEDLNESEQKPLLQVTMKSATTTRGSNIVSDEYDATGIMIWPATHLLCQHLALSRAQAPGLFAFHQRTVLELGCGCGLVGIVAMTPASTTNSTRPKLWVATDMDATALKLCQENYTLNGIQTLDCLNGDECAALDQEDSHNPRPCAVVKRLEWGSDADMDRVLSDLKLERFDCVVGADIVYPNTCGKILADLFQTVDRLLSLDDDSRFYLSFATRDGHKTPSKFIEAATDAGFAISSREEFFLDADIVNRLPPLLDSKILILTRSACAEEANLSLGGDGCSVFPGLKAALARLEEHSSIIEEEWEAPFSWIW